MGSSRPTDRLKLTTLKVLVVCGLESPQFVYRPGLEPASQRRVNLDDSSLHMFRQKAVILKQKSGSVNVSQNSLLSAPFEVLKLLERRKELCIRVNRPHNLEFEFRSDKQPTYRWLIFYNGIIVFCIMSLVSLR